MSPLPEGRSIGSSLAGILAQGAAGVQLGPMALGVAAELNKKHGLTLRASGLHCACFGLHNLRVVARHVRFFLLLLYLNFSANPRLSGIPAP